MQKGAIKLGMNILSKKVIIPGVPAIIKNSKGEILLEKRAKNLILYPDYWGLPGGFIEIGETIEQAISRELREELGVKSKIIKYGKPAMQLKSKECPIQGLSTPVYCKITSGKPEAKDETAEIRWFSPKEIRNMNLAYIHKKILKNEGLI